jgi:N-acetylglucosamine kinase-like BadF-type ATPase
VCLGFSGGAADKEVYVREIIRSRNYKITHDAEIALIGATEGRPGIITIAGTGSMAFGRNVTGKTARAGGWGYIFGDEGSAFDIVRQALRAALQFEEGWGTETVLRERLIEAAGASDANDLLHRFYTEQFPRDRVAAYAPLVSNSALDGDQAATTILRMAGSRLASLARGVHESLFQRYEAVPVSYIGGVFRSDAVRNNFADDIKDAIGCDVTPPVLSPVAGAVLEALRTDANSSRLSNVPESER